MIANISTLAHRCRILQAHRDRDLSGDKIPDCSEHPLRAIYRLFVYLAEETLRQIVLRQTSLPISSNTADLKVLFPQGGRINYMEKFKYYFA